MNADSARTEESVDFSYYIMDEEVYADMKAFQPKKDREQKFMIPCENE